jgi:competence protein ComEC
MRIPLALWCCGLLLVQLFPQLPQSTLYWSLFASVLILSLLGRGRWRWLTCLLVAMAWASWYGADAIERRLPEARAGQTLRIEGSLLEAPRRGPDSLRFDLIDANVLGAAGWPARRATIRLTWYGAADVPEAGMRCRVYVRLKPPRGLRNVGGFDAERWYFANAIRAIGYVVAHPSNRCERAPERGLSRLRYSLAAAIAEAVEDSATASILSALAVGVRAEISDSQWRLLRDTGVIHLISVSGLHLGMVAVLAYSIVQVLFAGVALRYPKVPASDLAACAALTITTGYAVLTGLSLPTQRTLVMVAIGLWARTRAGAVLSVDTLLVAAALLLTINPLAGLSLSFWFSFGTLGLVLFLGQVRPRRSGWRMWLENHVWLALLAAPITAFVFQSVSVISPVANALAIPVVTLLVVPLLLVGICLYPCFPTLSSLCWGVAAICWQVLANFLERVGSIVEPLVLPQLPSPLMFVVGLVAMLLLFLPFRALRILLAPSLVLLSFAPRTPELRSGEFQLDVLDVGQGLSVVVTTAKHTLVYDTGASFVAGGDMGAQVVVPFLNAIGRRRIHELMISHSDNDHAGGADSILAALKVERVTAPTGTVRARGVTACVAGRAWRWDGVEFDVLYPAAGQRGQDNNLSCVLRVRGVGGSALLPGDIEKEAEHALSAAPAALGADIVLIPHHGSKSSSTAQFIAAVAPRYAIVSAGYRNRFGHPADAVVKAYKTRGIEVFSTAEHGAITVRIGHASARPSGLRERDQRYWDP